MLGTVLQFKDLCGNCGGAGAESTVLTMSAILAEPIGILDEGASALVRWIKRVIVRGWIPSVICYGVEWFDYHSGW